ncbi:MAG: isopeptide-forming domain-containing fimbrial protein [Lachnospiraceae bacterium]|nr:isopeptide-forming domain-containing fimbrial protein [Lachnospiraceae bacterium]
MKRVKKMMALMIAVVMCISMSIAVFAADHEVSTTSTTHTYQIYQIFTGTYDSASGQLQNLKYGHNAKTGTEGNSVSATDMAALDAIAKAEYKNDQERITALSPYVDLTSTPIAEIGKGKEESANLAEGYYIIKDTDSSLSDPETYTLYLFKVLSDDLAITPKSGTTTVDKDVTETNDTTGVATAEQKGADYDEGDSIPYSIDITLAENVHDYKTYKVTLTDTLSEGLTPPAASDVTVTFKKGTTDVADKFGTPNVTVSGQVITVTYTYGDGTNAIGDEDLDGAVINVSYEAVLNSSAKTGVEGNPNTYTITYTNNPNGDDTGTTPERKVYVYTYELDINKVDGNNEPLQGADFTLYKEVTSTYTGAQTGAAIKASLATGVDGSKLEDAKYYVAVGMNENVIKDGDTVTAVTHKTDTNIDAGNYVLVETTVPAGYNAYAGQEIVITSTIDATTGELTDLTATPDTLTVASDKDVVSGGVENKSGSELPYTGGIGRTIFIVVGGVLVAAAVALLIVRKRRAQVHK